MVSTCKNLRLSWMIQLRGKKNPSRTYVIHLSYKHSDHLKIFTQAAFSHSAAQLELPLSPCSFQPHPFPWLCWYSHCAAMQQPGRERSRWKWTRLHTSQPAGSLPYAVAQAFVQVQWKKHGSCFGQYHYQKMLWGTTVSVHQPVDKL